MTEKNADVADSGESMDIADVLAKKTEVSDAHVDAGISALVARIHELRNKAKSDGLSDDELAEAKQRRAEWDELTNEKAVRATRREEADAAFDGVPDPDEATGEEPADDAKGEEPEPAAEPEQPAEQTEEQPEAVAASAETPKPNRLKLGTVTKDREPSATQTGGNDGPKVSMVAAAGDRNHATGENLTPEQMYEALWNRHRRLSGSQGGSGDYITVATLEHPVDETRHLSPNNVISNDQKIAAVTQPQALTAAGVCAPYVIDYSMGVIGTTARPVKAAFPSFTADRGGIQFRRDVDALGGGPASASGTWSLETDASPSGSKPIWEVPCNTVVSAEVTAVTLGLKFSNITNLYDPEAIAANTQAASIAHSRYAEQLLLNSMYSQCTATFQHAPSVALGATRDLLVAIDKVRAYWRDARRIGDDVPLRVILPHWVLDLMRADLVRALHTSNAEYLGEGDATILQWFTNRGITPSWTLDGRAAQSASGTGNTQVYAMAQQGYTVQTGSQTMPGFPDQVEFAMFPEGTFVYLDGGQLDVGVVRDQNLVQNNRYITFMETFEGLYRRGIEAVRVVASVQPIGGSAGTIDTHLLAD